MKTLVWIASLTVAMALGASAQASNLITDGDFSLPNQGGGWTIYSPGTNGWLNSNGDGIEIGTSTIYGLPCANSACQQLEVNANAFDTDQQTVNGLIVGHTYDLSYLYGGRTSGGPDILDVSFGGTPLIKDSGSIGYWTLNSFSIVATSTTETLVFSSEVTSGLPSYGNEITNVSLTATPLPSTWTMLIAGFVGLGFFAYRGTKKNPAPLAAA
jgi:hypothetical protein